MGKKRRGHYCRGCDLHVANEKFDGKGHRQHLCKDCKKSKEKEQRNSKGYQSRKCNTNFDADENFAFIEGYTSVGVPFGITHEDWDEIYDLKNDVIDEQQIVITVPKDIAEKLRNNSTENSIEKSIYYSIALYLFSTNVISIERAAYLADYQFNDFIFLLQNNGIPWNIENKDDHIEYQKSIDHLLITIDNLMLS